MRDVGAFRKALRRTRIHSRGEPLRILVADDDATRRHLVAGLLVERYAPAVALEAADVPSAIESLLVRHPDLVVADLCLSGHTQGGFRLILDAASLGVPAVVTSGPISRALEERLSELGVGWVAKGSSEQMLVAAVDRALSSPYRGLHDREGQPPPSGPRMHTA